MAGTLGGYLIPATLRRCFRWGDSGSSNASSLCVLVRSANYAKQSIVRSLVACQRSSYALVPAAHEWWPGRSMSRPPSADAFVGRR